MKKVYSIMALWLLSAVVSVRYNSRLPVGVYAPEGVEVRYRIWSAESGTKAVEKGLAEGAQRGITAESKKIWL